MSRPWSSSSPLTLRGWFPVRLSMSRRATAPIIRRDRLLKELVPMTGDSAIGLSRREQTHGDSGRRGQIGESHPNPHQGTGALLVAQRKQLDAMPRNFVVGICNAITKNKKR